MSSRRARPAAAKAAPRHRGWGLAATLLLALASGCAGVYLHAEALPSSPVLPAGHPAAALPRDGIDVLVWNVKKAQRAAWQPEFEALARDKELVLLQEVYLPRMVEPLAARTELQWLMSPSFAFAWRLGAPTTGVAIGSAARALDHRTFVTIDTEPFTATPKAAIAAIYELEAADDQGPPERLLVVSMHGINFRPAHALEAQLRALEPIIGDHDGPVLFAGDLNTHHRPRMAALEQFAARVGLRSVFDNTPRDRSSRDARTRYGGWPLDHVYVRGLVVDEARVAAEARGSDHEPMVLRLSTAPRPAGPYSTVSSASIGTHSGGSVGSNPHTPPSSASVPASSNPPSSIAATTMSSTDSCPSSTTGFSSVPPSTTPESSASAIVIVSAFPPAVFPTGRSKPTRAVRNPAASPETTGA
jgi:endonuclease/exonuclease/phosphatase (EEP) superfamily protein YafD